MAVPKILTRILKEPWEVDPELARLNLTRAKLLKVRTMALGAAADALYHMAQFMAQIGAYLRGET